MNVLTIFYHFLMLGCTSFGGPAAHLSYFQRHFVEHKQWLSQQRYAQLIALSQILPGPGSSQVGFAIGLERGGLLGGIAAFVGFTLPSALIMALLALSATALGGSVEALITGLKLFAVVIVLDAIISMGKSFCTTWLTRGLALGATAVLLLFPQLWTQIALLLISALIGVLWLRPDMEQSTPSNSAKLGKLALLACVLLFASSFFTDSGLIGLAAQFYQAGSLVFGGGHVVLPLLENILVDVDSSSFLSGYAAAQGIPGPMFTFATYLGAVMSESTPVLGALIATLAIFLPGFLLILAFNDYWQALSANPLVAGISRAINATVVGFILAALINPIAPAALVEPWYALFVVVGLGALRVYKLPVLMVLAGFAALGFLLTV